MNEQEKNKILNEWAGTKKVEYAHPMYGIAYCFKWLVPKAIDKIMARYEISSDIAYPVLFHRWMHELELNIKEPALALCDAIIKLIVSKI